ncbi:PHP domain-containing protein [Microbacterium hydrocarbonoxydans]|uniref:PHP domain-containing protein n=1 Tax=Microbacterium hydrocarbonoxydans TaxID=273678 RepID=UPI0007BC479B|nr:PHP domain-containing protein [Microbacterium hydrocarbonoxydans]GAT72258.1 PHP domaiouter membrane phospholipase An-containing protein [Microbacterium sp. HM58-2]
MFDHDTHGALPIDTDAELRQLGFSRREMLRTAGIALAAGAVATMAGNASAAPASASTFAGTTAGEPEALNWLVGDHHVHTQFSHDAKYRIAQQLDAAQRYGIDWLAFTEHSNVAHAERGLASAREQIQHERETRGMLLFQGLEWYIPGAEHATVLVEPGADDARTLRAFELAWDGKLNRWERPVDAAQAAEFERRAAEAIAWLGAQKRAGVVGDAVVLANHPMRLGIDSPHEFRLWRDAAPDIMIGMEGAPGAQASAISQHAGPGDQRGEYVNSPRPDSWPGYPADAYRPYGGFDWATATVGGLWDALLAEGKPFWITSNSDNHLTAKDTWVTGPYPDGEPYASLPSEYDRWAVLGKRPDPIDTGVPQGGSDFWPGQFSRLHTGVTTRSYAGVLDAMRRGRMWVDHGHLLSGFDVRAQLTMPGKGRGRGNGAGGGWGNAAGRSVTLGGRLTAKRGQDVVLTITVTTTDYVNAAGILPQLAHVDLIAGPITGPAADADAMRAPETRVVHRFDTTARRGTFTLTHVFERVERPFYVRFRGSDGKRNGTGYHGASVDPAGPIRHGAGEGDPWLDTWFYANPIFVDVV